MKKSACSSAAEPGMSKKSARIVYRALLAYSKCQTSWEERALLRSISSVFPETDSFSGESKRAIARTILAEVSPTKWGAFMVNLRGAGALAENITKAVKDAAQKESGALASAAKEKERILNEEKAFEALVEHACRPAQETFSMADLGEKIAGKHVLFVEDNQTILEASGKLFAALGANVSLAVAGGTAIHHAQKIKFDVVVLDHNLVFELGTDVARDLRELYKESNPNAIFISFSADARNVLKVPGATGLFNDFAQKPDTNSLMSRIFEAISRQENPCQG